VASECLAKNDMERFYEEVLKALWGYLGDKFSVPQSSLNKKAIMEILKSKGVDDNKIDELSQIIDTYEFARYAPSSSEAEASDLYARALGFINYLEGFVGR
ncbi:MAG TPA: protein BatD, partial [Bacteroidetes bacterium]|nr:protein BatD [Bacteroidota bacterium]